MNTSARQYVAAAVATILHTDVPAGVVKNLFSELPNGTIPLSLEVVIVTPFNTTGTGPTEVLDIGNGDGGSEYANDVNLMAAAGTRVQAAALPGPINTTDGGLQLTATRAQGGTALTQPTAGEARVILTYAREGVENFSEG